MASDRGDDDRKHRAANENRPPNGQDVWSEADVSARVDAVVLTIARLIGRQIAREHFEALQAANDNHQPIRRATAKEDRSGEDDDS